MAKLTERTKVTEVERSVEIPDYTFSVDKSSIDSYEYFNQFNKMMKFTKNVRYAESRLILDWLMSKIGANQVMIGTLESNYEEYRHKWIEEGLTPKSLRMFKDYIADLKDSKILIKTDKRKYIINVEILWKGGIKERNKKLNILKEYGADRMLYPPTNKDKLAITIGKGKPYICETCGHNGNTKNAKKFKGKKLVGYFCESCDMQIKVFDQDVLPSAKELKLMQKLKIEDIECTPIEETDVTKYLDR
jgi:hypothetical protein